MITNALGREFVQNGVLLGTWWALWTLADCYLIPASPWSEVGVLLLCACVAATPFAVRRCQAMRNGVARQRVKLDEALDRI